MLTTHGLENSWLQHWSGSKRAQIRKVQSVLDCSWKTILKYMFHVTYSFTETARDHCPNTQQLP